MTLSTPDAETIGVYDAKCDEYENMVARKREGREAVAVSQENSRATFLDGLPPNAKILDYGCGPGHDAALFAEMKSYEVTAFDGSAEMVKLARARSPKVAVSHHGFDVFTAAGRSEEFDGIWASSSLLHAARSDFPAHLAAIHRALKPSGILFLGMKTRPASGDDELRDEIGRLYVYYDYDELEKLLTAADFSVESHTAGTSVGLDKQEHGWVKIFARRSGA